MKKSLSLFFCIMLAGAASYAQFSTPGAKVISQGLKIDSATVYSGGAAVELKPFPNGTKLTLSLAGIHGFSSRDGKSFPGISMSVIDKSGKKIVDYADLMSEYPNGVESPQARYLNVSLTVGAPMTEGVTYNWAVRVWDKNGKSSATIDIPVTVSTVKDAVGIKKIPGGLTCKNAFIMDTAPLTSNQVQLGTEIFFVMTGIEGYKIVDGKAKIGASMAMKDESGTVVLEYTDLFKDEDTYPAKDVETFRLNLTLGDPITSGMKYTWNVKVWDKLSGKKIDASCLLMVK